MEDDFEEPIRIAHVIGKYVGGGVESVVMNYYRNINRNKIQFDFICDEDSTNIPYKEIKSLGGKVILIPPYQKVFKYQRELKRILTEGKYKIVHSHINALSIFSLFAAKRAGVPTRIAHSHSTSNKKEWKKNLLKNVLRPFSKVFSTHYFTCSEHAGRWLFGNKTFEKGKVVIINNGINIENFLFDEKTRNEKRNELKFAPTDIVIGHVGRFTKQKNHDFIIDVFYELYKRNNNYKLILIGQGPLQNEIKEKVKRLKLEKNVQFLGQKEDVNKYYQAMDLFLFPSLYEGLGIVVIEAQASGLPCVVSTEIPQNTKIYDRIEFISLKEALKSWTNITENVNQKERIIDISKIREAGYDIQIEAKKLEDIYIKIYRNEMELK